jgi:hypothetical protein
MIVSKNVDLWLCPSFSDRDTATCLLRTKKGNDIYVTSVYMDQLIPDPPEAFQRLLREKGNTPVLICTDSNAHSSLWGQEELYPAATERGRMIENLLEDHDLSLVNTGTVQTFITSRASSIIDLTICSHSLLPLISGWHVNPDYAGSDHRRIEFQLAHEVVKPPCKWDFKRTNWITFKDCLEELSSKWLEDESRQDTTQGLDQDAKLLQADINKALRGSSRWIQPGSGPVKLNWWI